MELRVLKYFLAVAREQNFSNAANSLHLSQPTLSRQIKELEEEIGKQLLIRGSRKITLTEDGVILRKRAEEIVELVEKTEKELSISDTNISGDIYIGTGESEGVKILIKAGIELQKLYPNIHLHTISGDAQDIIERLDKGLYDFAVLWEPADLSDYESLKLPHKDVLSLLMPADCELAKKDTITSSDLLDIPVIVSRQQLQNHAFDSLIHLNESNLNIVGTYNLIYNASLMVKEGMGYAIGLDGIIDTSGNQNLICKPITPITEVGMSIVWKKYQIFTKASRLFLDKVTELCSSETTKIF